MLLLRSPYALVVLWALGTPAQAAETATRSVTVQAAHARVTDLAGELSVVVEDRSDVRVTLSGPKRWVEAMQPRTEGATAVLAAPTGTGGNSVSVNSVSVFSSGGGSASVTIGGQTVDAGGDEIARKLELRLPRQADLTIAGLTGRCAIGALSGRLTLQLRSGSCSLAGLNRGGELVIDGSGSLQVQSAAGTVLTAINGTGQVDMAAAQVDQLTVRIAGNGTVAVDGVARRADLTLNGVGTIRVREVTERPRQAMNGAGLIEVGNWR